MLVTVIILDTAEGGLLATVPDLPGCDLTDTDEGPLFARIRLALEGALADRLLGGQVLPTPSPASRWKNDPRYSGGRFYAVHMNLDHLRAVARHQQAWRAMPGT